MGVGIVRALMRWTTCYFRWRSNNAVRGRSRALCQRVHTLALRGGGVLARTFNDSRMNTKYFPLIYLFIPCVSASPACQCELPGFETISSQAFLAIQSAAPELGKRNLSVDGYRITVMNSGKNLPVLFQDPSLPLTALGSSSSKPALSVELSAVNYKVVSSNYVR